MKKIIRRLIRFLLKPIYIFLASPYVRYSTFFPIIHYNPREEILNYAMEYVSESKLEGDYLEFGVFEGKSFIAAYHFAQRYHLITMKFYAFDSFKGLPEIQGIDAEEFRHFRKGQYSAGKDKFIKNIFKKEVNLKKVTIIPGWYDEVLNEETKNRLQLEKAAIIFNRL